MGMHKFTAFGLCVKKKLLDVGQPQKWLEKEVSSLTGLYVDGGYLYKILTGRNEAPKIKKAICEILQIPENEF